MKKTALAAFMLVLSLVILFQISNVATAGPPIIKIYAICQIDSPKNVTYTSGDIPLKVVVTGDASERNFTVAYRSIHLNTFTSHIPKVLGTYLDDGKPKVYDSALNLKQDGPYELRVTISYASAVVARQVHFTVQTNQPTPSPSPTSTSFSPDLSSMIVSIAVSVAVVCTVSFVYFKKLRGGTKHS